MPPLLVRVACVAFAAGNVLAAEPAVDSSQLPRVPPTPPDQALSTFQVKPGFRLELVAAEPLVVSPVAMSFDEDGRLYVIEMRDYSERRPERLGRIRLLEDTDGDGRFDKSTVFADGLPWPTAVICWAGGVFVGATPDILYFKDTTGDGKADVRETIFTGFGSDYAPFETNKLNVQALMNSFNWSLDNRIHGATSFSGGKVKRVDSPFVRDWLKRAEVSPSPGGEGRGEGEPNPTRSANFNPPLDLRGRDFSFDPRTLAMRPESGGGQHGMSFDNRGRKFVCSNSDHIQLIMYDDRYAARNPYYNMPSPRVSIAVDGPAAEVYRISPDEPWRVLRTQWRVAGLVPGPVEGGGRPSGYFTGATGVTIYRGDAYGEDFVGDAFIGDAGSNLVHRKKLRPDGVLLRAERPADEQKVEFLASTDNWFRPVQFANAPDGCLYIADMYREVIEHPWSLPANLKKHLDLNSGNDRGRLYRIVPENFKLRPLPRLSKASTANLVRLIEHTNGWHRDTAARLLYERQDKAAVTELAKRLEAPERADTRICLLHALASLNALTEEQVIDAMGDRNAAVREHAVKLSEPLLKQPSEALVKQFRSQMDRAAPADRDSSSDFQMGLAIGILPLEARTDLLARFLERIKRGRSDVPDGRPNPALEKDWLEAAFFNSLGENVLPSLLKLGSEPVKAGLYSGFDNQILGSLSRLIGIRASSNEVSSVVDLAVKTMRPGSEETVLNPMRRSWIMVAALEEGLRQGNNSIEKFGAADRLAPVYALAGRWATNEQPPSLEQDIIAAIKVLGIARYSESQAVLLKLLTSAQSSPEVRKTSLQTISGSGRDAFAPEILNRWPQLTPALRAGALELFLKRPERAGALVAALEKGTVQTTELSIAQQALLRSYKDKSVREQAVKVLGRAAPAARQSVVEAFQSALGLKGDMANGGQVFQTRCASCHKLGSEGHALGPDLATVKSGGKEKLLVAILDPNREVAPNFASYDVETKDGESLTGILASENASSVTLRMAGGAESVIARANIASLQSQGRSLMPEGLEEALKPQDLADLLEFIVGGP